VVERTGSVVVVKEIITDPVEDVDSMDTTATVTTDKSGAGSAQFLRNPQRYIEARYLPPAVCKHVRMISRMGSHVVNYTHALYRASHTCMCIALVTKLYARRKRAILV
jgi:hypothetical protein